jgi:hypothetical protein
LTEVALRRLEVRAVSERPEASPPLARAQLWGPPEVRAVLHAMAASPDVAGSPSAASHADAAARSVVLPQEGAAHAAALREEAVRREAAAARVVAEQHAAGQPSEAARDERMARPSGVDLSVAGPSSLQVRFRRGPQPARGRSARIARATALSSAARS